MLMNSKYRDRSFLLLLVICLGAGCAGEGSRQAATTTSDTQTTGTTFTVDESDVAYVMIQVRKDGDDGTVVNEPEMHDVAKAINYVLLSNQQEQKISSLSTEGKDGQETFMVLREYANFSAARDGATLLAAQIRNTPGVLIGQPFAIPRSRYVQCAEAKNFDDYADDYFATYH